MKKLILIAALIMLVAIAYGQNLKRGNVIGFHVFTLTLGPGVTMEQYLDFFNTKWIPAYEKNFQGVKVYFVRGIKSDCINCNGMMLVWNTKADMEKYWKPSGGATELTNTTLAKLDPLHAELLKLGRISDDKFTDWEIQ